MEHKSFSKPEQMSILPFPFWMMPGENKLSLDEICQLIHEHGIRMLDLMDAEVDFYGKENLQEAFRRNNVRMGVYIAYISAADFSDDELNSPDGIVSENIDAALEMAQAFGTKILMIVPMPQDQSERSKALSREEKFQKAVKVLRKAVKAGAEKGIEIVVEDCPSCEIPLSSIADCKRMAEEVPGLGIVYDTANMIPSGDDPWAFYKELKPYIRYVHLKDVIRIGTPTFDPCLDGRYLLCCSWGEGEVPVRAIYEQMKKDGYTGSFAVEYVLPEDGPQEMEANHRQMEKFIEYLEGDER